MASKLAKSTYPAGHKPEDFEAFGPPAMEDGNFSGCKIADMGSFSQDEKDSNKFYCAMVCKSRLNKKFYVYLEWGRVGAKCPQFQMVECDSEQEAQEEFESVCHEKNDRRGVWTTVAGIRTLTAKPGKDVYLVRQLTTRSTGLPDAKTIKYLSPTAKPKIVSENAGNSRKVDEKTASLLRDLTGGTVKYTRSAMADNSLPTQTAIDQGRQLLYEAQRRVATVGDHIDSQVADRDLRLLSSEMYRRIPKVKPVGTPDSVWILSGNNIVSWQQDLDAFESAISGSQDDESDPFCGLPLHMEWIDPKTVLGKFLNFWWPKATANRHGHIGNLKIKNLWKVDRHGDDEKFEKSQRKILAELGGKKASETPLFQPSERCDVPPEKMGLFSGSNTALLHHGSRSVNIKGILEKSLLLPKQLVGVAITGANFGPAVYTSDDIKKSCGYTSLRGSIWSGGSGSVAGRDAFMFICDVALGEPHVAPGSHGYTQPPKGSHCVFGKGRNHGSGRNSGVENNEWMIYDTAQCRLRYLVEFTV